MSALIAAARALAAELAVIEGEARTATRMLAEIQTRHTKTEAALANILSVMPPQDRAAIAPDLAVALPTTRAGKGSGRTERTRDAIRFLRSAPTGIVRTDELRLHLEGLSHRASRTSAASLLAWFAGEGAVTRLGHGVYQVMDGPLRPSEPAPAR